MSIRWFYIILIDILFSGIVLGQFKGEINLSSTNVVFIGENAGDQAGYHLSVIGDVNSDGFDDVLIAAPFNDQAGNDCGQVYLIFGKSSGWIGIGLTQAAASFLGTSVRDWASHDVYGIGDVNLDGIDDLAIGVKFVDQPVRNAGKIYIFYGKKTGWTSKTPLENADASFIGEADEYAEAGHVMPVGDVNGDGLNDIIIGAGFNDQAGLDAGKVYLVFGKADGWGKNVSLAHSDASFLAEASGDNAGHRVAGVGDVNGDGLNDFLIGANGKDANILINAGKAYLVFGKTAGWSQNISLASVEASFLGPNKSQANFGWNLCGAGDVNGDHLDDLLIAAQSRATIFLVFGKTSGWSSSLAIIEVADVTFTGEGTNDHAGYDMRSLGDLDGDGYGDFIIGAYGNNQVGALAGKAYLFYGRPNWSKTIALVDADAAFLGEAAGDSAGWAVAGGKGYFIAGKNRIGDLNGDGAGDVLIAAPRHSQNAADAGKVYVFLGQQTDFRLTKPNGGETWELGQRSAITWISANSPGNVRIELSRDAGLTWEFLKDVVDSGAASWDAETSPSRRCLIKITQMATGRSDQSDATFSIINPPIEITSPNGGESWYIGSTQAVSWRSPNAGAQVKIQLSRDNAMTWETLMQSIPDTGSWRWTVTGYPSVNCWIRLIEGPGLSADTSDGAFTIEDRPAITLVSPNGGERWQIDSEHEIHWQTINIGDSVTIDLSRNGQNWETLTSTTPNTGKFLWQVTGPAADSCRMRIQELGSAIADTSDVPFTITPLTDVSPIGSTLPQRYALWQNFPNPFNPSTTIQLDLPVASLVVLKLYDVRGREIRALLAQALSAGRHTVILNAMDLPAGIYFYQIKAGDFRAVKKMLLLK